LQVEAEREEDRRKFKLVQVLSSARRRWEASFEDQLPGARESVVARWKSGRFALKSQGAESAPIR
jgi:hypothetical protein